MSEEWKKHLTEFDRKSGKKLHVCLDFFFSSKTGKQISGVWIPLKLEVQEETGFKRNTREFFFSKQSFNQYNVLRTSFCNVNSLGYTCSAKVIAK